MSTTTPEPLDASFQLSLPSFEGPLDLLLHLIRKHELEILDLPIAFVTERYLAYVTMMEKLDLDIASEYLVMAATLAHIKSKMLLPQEPEDQADEDVPEEEVDPRAELIKRLLEYQKYKDVAERLGSRGIAGRDVFVRGSDAPEASGPTPLAPTSLFRLLDAFQSVLQRAKSDAAFEITTEGLSIQDRMRELTDLLREKRELTFEELFEGQATIVDLVVTFMALLEMAKRRLVRIFQADPHSPIHLRSTVLSEESEEEAHIAGSWDDYESDASPESTSPGMSPTSEAPVSEGSESTEGPTPTVASEEDDLPSEEAWEEGDAPAAGRAEAEPDSDWVADYAAWDVQADEELEPGPAADDAADFDATDVDVHEDTGLALELPGADASVEAEAESIPGAEEDAAGRGDEASVEPLHADFGIADASLFADETVADLAEVWTPAPVEGDEPSFGDDEETRPAWFRDDAAPEPFEAGEPNPAESEAQALEAERPRDAEVTARARFPQEDTPPEPWRRGAGAFDDALETEPAWLGGEATPDEHEAETRPVRLGDGGEPAEPGPDEHEAKTRPVRLGEGAEPAEPGPDEHEAETRPVRVGEGGESSAFEHEAETRPVRFGEGAEPETRPIRFGKGSATSAFEHEAKTRPTGFDGDAPPGAPAPAVPEARAVETPASAPSEADSRPVAVLHAVAVTDGAASPDSEVARPESAERDGGSLDALDPDAGSGKQSDLVDSDEDEDEPT